MTLFIDTAVLMYAAGTVHPLREYCVRIVRGIGDGELDAVTSAEVVQEIVHRYMAIGRADVAAGLARSTLDLFAPVLPITHGTIRRLPELVARHPSLSARDLIHVATCHQEGIVDIVSPDLGFDTVPGLRRIDPKALAEPFLSRPARD